MPANLKEPFGPSCCESGGEIGKQSARSCGCDPGANHLCERHLNERLPKVNLSIGNALSEDLPETEIVKSMLIPPTSVRTFQTGATREIDTNKYDYEGFLSPLVLDRFAQYMHKHRIQVDGTLRDSANWQKGIPKEAYMKSGFRHFMDWWRQHRGHKGQDTLEDSLCALLFNVQGYLHELLKDKNEL